MSKQWTERDADDVLMSIRRLVSQRSAPVDPEAAPEAAPAGGKLVLTAAQRVSAAPADLPKGPADPETVWSLEDRIAELEDAIGARPEDWEPDGSEDEDQERPDQFVFQHRRVAATPVDEPPPLVVEAPDEDEAEAEPEVEVAEARVVADPDPAPAPVEEIAAESLPVAAEDLDRVLAAIDPETLRQMVAEILRAELQGDLGQKITRNVRKLVRQEIRRALLTQDLDGGR